MKRIESCKKDSLAGKLLRLLKSSGLQESIRLQEENVAFGIPNDSYYAYKEVKTALLEAERKKAEALMERQRRSHIY